MIQNLLIFRYLQKIRPDKFVKSSLLRLGIKCGTVTGPARDAVLRLGNAAIGTDGLLRLAAPTVITAVQILGSLCRHDVNHEKLFRPKRSAESAFWHFAGLHV